MGFLFESVDKGAQLTYIAKCACSRNVSSFDDVIRPQQAVLCVPHLALRTLCGAGVLLLPEDLTVVSKESTLLRTRGMRRCIINTMPVYSYNM